MASLKKRGQCLNLGKIGRPQLRKSVIYHTAPVKEQQDDPVLQALNTLITLKEFSYAKYGDKAKYLAYLDARMKEILENNYMYPDEKVKYYDRELQKYLFHVTKRHPHDAAKEEEEADDYGRKSLSPDLYERTTSAVIAPSTSAIFDETPRAHKTPFHFAGREPHKNNLPRDTPKAGRLRTIAERRKNSRLKEFLENWEEYV